MSNNNYHPEKYWSEVAGRILEREHHNVIAGDDEPYYRYKRRKFLSMLESLDFSGKTVLEVGSGPGGNLNMIASHHPKRLVGADISADMIRLAQRNTAGKAELVKIDGEKLPFNDGEFDLAFTATVLQHNTDEAMMSRILKEICRVTSGSVVLFERVENQLSGDELCAGRPVSHYETICQECGFRLTSVDFININASYYVSGAIRKGLNPGTRKEGEPLNTPSVLLQNITLPVTRILDRVFTSRRDLGKMVFQRS